jgi:hypothetical protein
MVRGSTPVGNGLGLCVARHRHAVRIDDGRAVLVELVRPQSVELHQLAAEVLVGWIVRGVRAVVEIVVEPIQHRRLLRNVRDQLREVPERVGTNRILVVRHRADVVDGILADGKVFEPV